MTKKINSIKIIKKCILSLKCLEITTFIINFSRFYNDVPTYLTVTVTIYFFNNFGIIIICLTSIDKQRVYSVQSLIAN